VKAEIVVIDVTDHNGQTRPVCFPLKKPLDWDEPLPPGDDVDVLEHVNWMCRVFLALAEERDELASKVKELKHELAFLRAETVREEE
jgi:hypothetical protein